MLVKSTAIEEGATLEEAARRGFIDPFLASEGAELPNVYAVNLRGASRDLVRLG